MTNEELKNLARDGRLRAAINTGNRALVQEVDGKLIGVSPALARRLAEAIGATLEPVVYGGAGKVFEDTGNNVWDVGFLAIDAMRAEKIAFTRPYVVIEATYAVRSKSPILDVRDADRPGQTVLLSAGSAYDMYLSKSLKHAALERTGTPSDSFVEFRNGRADLVAGVRESLEQAFGKDSNFRVLSGSFTKVEQAMVLPSRHHPLLPALDAFVERAIADGFVASELARGAR